ncbi:MAG: hypothetical protein IPL59_05390 [Candidatus Competibacteraceae bacterium]|uniref:Uncharacterized protein n=1 Tax=Candidatus Contendobacter odensis Run_B_J11 TaxID=1400861 RepID=A0A7U7GCN3_9GAMM|nr:hypothetical protein [Candidatus Contendobacter odensis]MBK8534589.1 hypothetical protein [Candidatus Competibacteraceae bacterium]CDH45827.1 hypothetical protein BN874_2900006 [Candidatus Contendobacter odensis Run_B_J11]
MELKQVKNSLESRSDEELRRFILHCERLIDSADEDLRKAAREALKRAREDRAARELLRGLPRHPDEGQ